jgi:hypothetical protein
VGFDDVGAFARSFARHCGETPPPTNDESVEHLESPGLPHPVVHEVSAAGGHPGSQTGDSKADTAPEARM